MSGKATLKNFKMMLGEAKLPERTVPVCLRGDLAADHEAAERELEQAQRTAANSLAGNGAAAIAERIEALEEQMREHTYDFRLRALPRHEFRTLLAAHPPREDEHFKREDAALGVNRDTFFPAIIHASVVDPELDAAEWADLLDNRLTDYQFQELAGTAWALNAREVDIPFSRAASRLRQATDAE
jgi:hypothetical protein